MTQQKTLEDLARSGVKVVQMELVDLDGALRGKFLPVSKVKPGTKGSFCTIVYQMTPADDVWISRHSSFDNGFPDITSVPDPDTVAVWNWQPDTAAVIFDLFDRDGARHQLSPRSILRRVADRFAETGFDPQFGIEYEAYVLQADDALMNAGRHHELKPLGRMHNAYRLVEADGVRELAAAFMSRMQSIGAEIDAFHTELGFGAVEFALAPAGAMRAADNAARAKSYFRQLCAERGLVATFMAKWKVGESGSGGHVHQSLWRNGENVFPDGSKVGFSETAMHYAGGLIRTMPDFGVIFRPNVNSYRRFDHRTWSPENASWGYDNRSAAIRAIRHPSPTAYRLEHRVPGADANIYLALAAMLAGGHHGLVNQVAPPSSAEGNAALDPNCARLPPTLPEATAAFRQSALAREYFGEMFVEHYAASRDVEWQHWLAYQAEQVTSYELKRYFQTI